MNALHSLQIVNDLALALIGESDADALTTGFLQRLLYHTGYSAALLAERSSVPFGGAWTLSQVLGNRDLARRVGGGAPWFDALVVGPSALLEDVQLPADAFQGAERYRSGIRLRASNELVLMLLGPSAPVHASQLPGLFEALLPRFSRSYTILRERAEHAAQLTAEIDRRRRVELIQRASEAQAEALLELSPQAMMVVDLASRRVVLANAQARRLFGLDATMGIEVRSIYQRALPDRGYRQVIRNALRARTLQALRSDGRLEPLDARMVSPDGGERHVELHAHLLSGRALVSVFDLTERMHQEDALRAAKEIAERANSAKSQFLSNVSHELRTPLNAILGFAQLLEADETSSEAHRVHAREILESGYHLLALVDDVLDLTRIESGRVAVSLAPVPLEPAVRETLGLLEAQAAARQVSFEVLGDWPQAVTADPTRLRQVLINLVSNAVKYNHDGGRVEVACELIAGAERRARVSVTDTGPGIPEARMSELFQPFSRLGAEALGVHGTGIGLTVAKQLVELMGGAVGVRSRIGVGSTFWFDLPTAAADSVPAPRTPPTLRTPRKDRPEAEAGRRAKLLVVEDQPMNQRLLCLQLEQVGSFDIVVVPHGARALDRWAQGDIDLVLTDCNMPFIDGYRLAALVREHERLDGRHVPIIAVTASAMKEDVDRCLAAGMDACLPKPLSVASLSEALEHWIPSEAARIGAAARPRDPLAPYYASIAVMLGDIGRDKCDELLRDFGKSSTEHVVEGRRLFELGQARALGQVMHKLKPSARLVGATVLAAYAELLEDAGRNDDLQTQREVWPLFEAAWRRVEADLAPPAPRIASRTPTSTASPRPRDSSRLRGLRALVIDDDPFTARYVADVLASFGITRVSVAEDGRSGLERVRESGPEIDLVLCDLAMPGMDGVELLRHLSDREFVGSFVFMSGADERVLDSVDGLARQHGFNVLGTLKKPFTADALGALLHQHRPAIARRTLETRLLSVTPDEVEQAIRGPGITIHLQPKVRGDTLATVGVEALARWFREGGAVPPSTFVRVAEAHGLADALFESVLAQSLKVARRLAQAGHHLKVSVNVSAASLARVEIAEQILRSTLEAEVDPKRLVLEVTETGLVRDLRIALDVLTRLRLHGIELSIDDFGTGYSTMDLLRRVPFTELKVDRSFVMNCVRDASARHIIASSVGLARGLGMRVVAEGVETAAELAVVHELGCEEIQGYYIARPMDEASLHSWLAERKR